MESSGRKSHSKSTSRSLLNHARQADAEAWERLVCLYAPLVASWCRKWGISEQDIVDVLQEVFASVSSNLIHFRKESPRDTFRGWLLVISRSKAMDYFRNRGREPSASGGTEASRRLMEIQSPDIANNPDEPLLPDDDIIGNDFLLRALDSIRCEFHEQTWRAFWKVVVDGRLTADVADELSMKPGTVRVAKSRVLMRLRRELVEAGPT